MKSYDDMVRNEPGFDPGPEVVNCAYCGRPMLEEDAEPMESEYGTGPMLVCSVCYDERT